MVSTRRGSQSSTADESTPRKAAEKKQAPKTPRGTPAKRTSSAAKTKNKVAATRTPLSPDLQSPVAAARARTGEASVTSSGGSTASNNRRPGLAFHVQKQLAADIEGTGGIKRLISEDSASTDQSLARLLDQRTDVYGKRATPLRKQIQNYVCRWKKKYNDGTYEADVLNRFQVLSFANLKKAGKQAATKPKPAGRGPAPLKSDSSVGEDSSQSSSSSNGTSSSGTSSDSGTVPQVIETQARASTPAAKATAKKPPDSKKTAEKPTAPAKMSMSPSNITLPANTHRIDVNVDRPEDNREVTVFSLSDIPGVKDTAAHFFGHWITLPMDIRHVYDDEKTKWYKARLWSENSVLLSVPAFPYSLLHNREEMSRSGKLPDYVVSGMDDGRHVYDERKASRKIKHMLLQFPESTRLTSSDIYEEAGDDEYLKLSIIPVEYTHNRVVGTNVQHWAGFTVGRTDVRPKKKGKLEEDNGKSDAAMLLQALYEPSGTRAAW